MRFLSCLLCKEYVLTNEPLGSSRVDVTGSGTQLQPGPSQTFNLLQPALLSVEGNWFRRAEGLLQILVAHGFVAQLYGFTRPRNIGDSDWFVLLPETYGPSGNDDDERVTLVKRVSALQPSHTPTIPLVVARGPETSAARSSSPSAAIPLIQAGQLVGCLYLAERIPAPSSEAEAHPTAAAAAAGGTTAAASAQPTFPAPQAAALLRSDDTLRQLSFAASLVLGGSGSDSLRWLMEAVARLRATTSMQALTSALCTSLEDHVLSRFVLEPAVSAALVPPAVATAPPVILPAALQSTASSSTAAASHATALLFRSPAASRGGARVTAEPLTTGVELDLTQVTGNTRASMREHRGLSTAQPLDVPQTSASAPTKAGAFNRPSRTADDGTGSSYGPGSPCAPSRMTPSQPQTQPQVQGLALTTANGSVSRCLLSSTEHVEPLSATGMGLAAVTGTGTGRSTARFTSNTAVVALSRDDLAAMASSAPHAAPSVLYAEAFSFRGSLLQAVLAAQQQRPVPRALRMPHMGSPPRDPRPPSAPSAGLPSPPPYVRPSAHSLAPERCMSAAAAVALSVIEDSHQHLQNTISPSRDVCLLMEQRPGGVSAPKSLATGGGEGADSLSALAGRGLGSAGRQPAPESLVVLTASLHAGAVLGLYLCFPRRLPGPLLEAVRASCQELLDKVLAEPVREQLMGPLAIEYDTLKSATPGSYAVLRGLAVSDDVPTAAAGGAAALGMPPPTYGGDGNSDKDSEEEESAAAAVARQRAHSLRPVTRQRSTALGASGGESVPRAASFTSRFKSADSGEATPFVETMRRRLSSALRPSNSTSAKFRVPAAAAAATAATYPTADAVQTAPPTIASASAITTAATTAVAAAPRGAAGAPFMRCRTDLGDFRTTAESSLRDLSQTCGLEGHIVSGPAELLLDTSTYGFANAASIITVAADAPTSIERTARRMDLLVGSIHSTLQASVASVGASSYSHPADLEQLQLVEVLGRGGGGVVLKGVLRGSLPVAVKLVELAKDDATQPDEETGLYIRRAMLRHAMELAVQAALSHPNIVQFYGTFSNVILRSRETSCAVDSSGDVDPSSLYLQVQSPDADQGTATEPDDSASNVTCILAELCDRGSLLDALVAGNFPPRFCCSPVATSSTPRDSASGSCNSSSPAAFAYDMRAIYMTLLDVALALRHLHSMNLVHRDLKPANLLLKSSSHDYRGFTVKLADFGFVIQLSETSEDGSRYASVESPCGTLTHMAPECLQKNAMVDAAADVYSFGILMWELLAGGVRPFANVAVARIPRLVRSGARPSFAEHVPQHYRGLAHQCWRTEPQRRPRAAELVAVIGSLLSGLKQ